MQNNGPLIVQSDMAVLVDVDHPLYAEARDKISPFAELQKSPEHIHTYKISALSLWNAASAGHSPEDVISTLEAYSRFTLPINLTTQVSELMSRYGKIRLIKHGKDIILETDETIILLQIQNHKNIRPLLGDQLSESQQLILPMTRGKIKMELTKIGFPAEDLAGYTKGSPLDIRLRTDTLKGFPFKPRKYQDEAASVFDAGGSEKGGSGIIVLPCGSGKTVVGMVVMTRCAAETLIVTTNVVASRQWIRELLDKTHLKAENIGEYNGTNKSIKPVTVATYQILTYRKRKTMEFPHFDLFQQQKWGLIIYDEVHLLPAPLFRISADMQATRRLGLTATLIREDGKEKDVFSLIGPKKIDIPWKILEGQGWIAQATCEEVRVKLDQKGKMDYAISDLREKITVAASNPEKTAVVRYLLKKHRKDQVLIIGQYLAQLNNLKEKLQLPLITGATPNNEREILYQNFREGKITALIVSKVGNFAVDLPDANVLIQISGTFGSRQEEAQRLGRLLRPKADGGQARFYSVVSRETREQEFAMNRQLFLTEQGYKYTLSDWNGEVIE